MEEQNFEGKDGEQHENSREDLIEKRKKKAIDFFKKSDIWVVVVLLILVIFGFYIRSLPMQDHAKPMVSFVNFLISPGKALSGTPGLWDVAKNDWTLGPDLDPWLFERYTHYIVETGDLPEVDEMRNVPLGFEAQKDARRLLPYMMAGVYYTLNIFTTASIEYSSIIFPVIMFCLTIISFFLFVREIFVGKERESKIKANIIALISTLLMIVIPAFLSRTVAGIPEKESAAFFFMFLTFYLFLKSWKVEKIRYSAILAISAGIATALMALVWGGITYIYITIDMAVLFSFILNKVDKKHFIAYVLWLFVSFALIMIISDIGIRDFTGSIDTGIAILICFVIAIHFTIWKTKIKDSEKLKKVKLPKTVISLIIALIIGLVLISFIFGPSFIINKIKALNQTFFKPVTGRWNTTVAENRQPYFTEWGGSFGPFYKGMPILFWLFFIGSILLFKEMIKELKKKDTWILTLLYLLFLFGLVFSRYAGSYPENQLQQRIYTMILLIGLLAAAVTLVLIYLRNREKNGIWRYISLGLVVLIALIILMSLMSGSSNADFFMNGENRISKGFYYLSALVLILHLAFYFREYHLRDELEFEKIRFEYLFLFSLFALCLFTARSAVRLIMVLAPIAPIFVGYLIVESADRFRKTKEEKRKIIWGVFASAVLVISLVFVFWPFYQETKGQAYSFVPSYYNQQWQYAMSWVRQNTSEDAVFGHWWDYGYWVQSIGNRSTVLDGGNAIVYWDYLMGRHVLTGDNQDDALEFLYNHNTTHFLIDSSDIGKYGAFSSIGSNAEYDRYSWIPTLLVDEKQTQEIRNGERRVYPGGFGLDEDLSYNDGEKEIKVYQENSGIRWIILDVAQENNTVSISQPEAIIASQGKQQNIPVRYVYYQGQFRDFGKGIEATIYIIPKVEQGKGVDYIGALIYISPRVNRGFLAQKYLLNDPFNKFPNFKLAHSEDSLIVRDLRSQVANLPEFVYYQGLHGPIKIWEIEYTGKEKIVEEYLQKTPPESITWEF